MRKMLVGLSLFLVLPLAQAQTYLNATGSPTFNTPEAVELGYVNLANGNLHLAVPFGSWPQRGAIGLSAGMVYDSRIWQIVERIAVVRLVEEIDQRLRDHGPNALDRRQFGLRLG